MADTLVVGTAADCTVVLNDPYVDPRHCRFYRGPDGTTLLVDLGSEHGTWLNGSRLEARVPAAVREGDHVRVGQTTLPIPEVPAPEPARGYTTSPGWTDGGLTEDTP